MNGNGTLTAALRVPVTPEFKRQLKVLARKQRRSLASTIRVLLEEAMELEESLRLPEAARDEYEIVLTVSQAARLIKKGYDLQIWKSPQFTQLPLI